MLAELPSVTMNNPSALRLQRPLAIFDLETTGVSVVDDRIVQIGVLKALPDGQRQQRVRLINPEMPIPAGATAVHGIRDEDVAGEPTFGQIARGLREFLADSDIAGYNVSQFDLPILQAEFVRVGVDPLDLSGVRIVDPLRIWRGREGHSLSRAVERFCGREHADAHDALADVVATADVLAGMMRVWPELGSLEALHAESVDPLAVDLAGKFRRSPDDPQEIVITFGKHRDRSVDEIPVDYLQWLANTGLPRDSLAVVRDAIDRRPGLRSASRLDNGREPR